MTVPLIEESSGSVRSGSDGTLSDSSLSTPTTSGRSTDDRQMLTVHVGDGLTLSQEDVEMLLVLLQTAALLAWFHYEVIRS